MSDVRWAKLWLRGDAAQVWAGWTAIVWCAAQSEERGTVSSAEDVSILSRVPLEMVKLGLEWGFSCGFIESRQDPAAIPLPSRQDPADLPVNPEIVATTLRYVTKQDETDVSLKPRVNSAPAWKSFSERCSERRQAWLEESGPCDFTKRPGRLQFASYCRAVHPQWTKGPAVFDDWALHGWNYKGKPIASWFQLLDSFAEAADQSEYGERLPMGEFASRMNLADGMSAKHLAQGEPL